MIVGTAGHIDHGKTTLVRALTGVDTDRLPEEKKRGISIELGYAFLDTPEGARIGFIDVPGHERLVHTMVAGASGIDFALLLVAADDGPMPQTHEHLAVLSLLGIARGAVAITKADRADPARLAAVQAEVAALLAPTPLAGAPLFSLSAATGQGIDVLRQHLLQAARSETGASATATGTGAEADANTADTAADTASLFTPAFRLVIDRAFTLAGAGAVVTGTVHAGRIHVGDEVAIAPGQRRARVRSLHAQNQPVQSAHAGQRCAVALVGVSKDELARGQWLCTPAAALATTRLDAQLHLWHAEPKALRSGARVLAHIGAAHAAATLTLLDADTLPPGGQALVQLSLHTPVAAWHGERVLLRDAAASRTLAGGVVLDPFAPTRYRRTPQRLSELAALTQPQPPARLHALLAAAPHGLHLPQLAAAQGWRGLPAAADVAPQLPAGSLLHDGHALAPAHASAWQAAALQALADFHQRQPDELGPDTARLRRLAAPRLPAPLWQALLADLAARGQVQIHGPVVHLPSHGAQLSATETRIAQKTGSALSSAGFEGAWARELARTAGEPEALVRTTLARLARRGELHQIVKDLYYPHDAVQRLVAIARQVAAAHGGEVQAARFRDATGLGRKRAIQILEYFDRIGLTRRVGDVRKLRPDSAWLQEKP